MWDASFDLHINLARLLQQQLHFTFPCIFKICKLLWLEIYTVRVCDKLKLCPGINQFLKSLSNISLYLLHE